ncbi:MAG: serine hydrolase, partial [Bacteroidota bacterium]
MALIPASEQYTRSKEDQVTQLLKAYNYDTVPGLALGIIKHGELIFAKGYGSANLDYEIPNTPNSRFYIGSMAKQFTGAALV